ncbi:nodulin MtN21 /EamA-like transporter family protein [Wolffia australiana]
MVSAALLLPSFLSSPDHGRTLSCIIPSSSSSFSLSSSSSFQPKLKAKKRFSMSFSCNSTKSNEVDRVSRSPGIIPESESELQDMDCIGTGLGAECLATDVGSEDDGFLTSTKKKKTEIDENNSNPEDLASGILEWVVLVSPFFFWGTAMVAMKEVIPKAGPFFVSAFRLLPAGLLLIGYARITGRKQPSGSLAWLSIVLFGIVDAACFQGFLTEGLQKTSAGLGSVIIDSQPLTVAILAALFFDESIGVVGAAGLALGVLGLLLLEVPAFQENGSAIWGSGEWWMFLAAQSMAVGTVMVRWVSKYSDPVMATGWHMVIGGLPLLAVSVLNHDPALTSGLTNLSSTDIAALVYTSVFGSAVSYGVFFYNASRGSLTKLSSLTFLTPMFASVFGFIYLGETFSSLQLLGALVTVVGIYLVNYKKNDQKT